MKWVSVKERYPNKAGAYFVTVRKNGKNMVGILRFRLNKQFPEFYNQFSAEPMDVTAWMYLPKPYKEEI